MKEYYKYGRYDDWSTPSDIIDGLVRIEPSYSRKYFDVFVYDKELSEDECWRFGMEFIRKGTDKF